MVFNNGDRGIYYFLENGSNYVYTGWTYEFTAVYQLEVTMDFTKNRWQAVLGGETIA